MAQLVLRHSCVADRLPVVVRFPAGPRVSFKSGDQPKGRWRRPKKSHVSSLSAQERPEKENQQVARSWFCSSFVCTPDFFSSSLAVNALWHGPEREISRVKRSMRKLASTSKGKSITHNKKNTTTQQNDPQIPQPDLRFVAREAKEHKKRGRVQTKTTTHDLPWVQRHLPLQHQQKPARNKLSTTARDHFFFLEFGRKCSAARS